MSFTQFGSQSNIPLTIPHPQLTNSTLILPGLPFGQASLSI